MTAGITQREFMVEFFAYQTIGFAVQDHRSSHQLNTEQRRRDALLFIEPSSPLAQRRLKHLAINAPDSADDNEYKILKAWWSGKRSLDCQVKN